MKIPKNKKYIFFGGIFLLANKLQMVADKKVKGLSTKQWFLLRNLKDLSIEIPPTITELAKETDTTRQNVRKMLEVLMRNGYVELKISGEDKRSQSVILTEVGEEILGQMPKRAEPFFAELFAGITEQEYTQAAKVILKLIDNLQKIQKGM